MKFKATLFIANKPNYNGRIYQEEVLDKAFSDKDIFGIQTIDMGTTEDGKLVKPFEKSSHKLLEFNKETYLTEVRYESIFEVLDTPAGTALKQMLLDDIQMAIAPSGYGSVKSLDENSESGDEEDAGSKIKKLNNVYIVEDYRIENFNIIPCEEYNSEYKITIVEE